MLAAKLSFFLLAAGLGGASGAHAQSPPPLISSPGLGPWPLPFETGSAVVSAQVQVVIDEAVKSGRRQTSAFIVCYRHKTPADMRLRQERLMSAARALKKKGAAHVFDGAVLCPFKATPFERATVFIYGIRPLP